MHPAANVFTYVPGTFTALPDSRRKQIRWLAMCDPENKTKVGLLKKYRSSIADIILTWVMST